jgi:LCP family protein required for cell wall assembly
MIFALSVGVLGIRAPRGTNTEDFIMDDEGNPILVSGADRKRDFFTILVIGADEEGGNTDTIMIASFDIQNGSYSVMSIPRDTMANVTRRHKKINSAVPIGGVAQLKREVFDLVGFNVDRYIYMELDGFEDIIDAIGGVEIDVPIRMRYRDPFQNLVIDLEPGVQILDGEQALNFVRFRGYPDADLGRIRAQQQFMTAVIKQMTNPMNFFRIPSIIRAVLNSTETDLTNGELIWLASKLRGISLEEVSMYTMPGEPIEWDNLSYYVAHERALLELINEKFNPFTRPITRLNIINHRALPSSGQGTRSTTQATPTPLPNGDAPVETPVDTPVNTPEPTSVPVVDVVPLPPPEPAE